MKTAALALLALLAGPPAVRLEVTPAIATAPQDLHVRIFVTRDPANRWLEVSADGTQFYRSTGFDLDGEDAPWSFDWWYFQLPCGAYVVRAAVTRADGHTQVARTTARYLGAGCED